jgi:hypothetical protein
VGKKSGKLDLVSNSGDQAFAVNRLLGSATLDRLRHNAYCLELDGPSFRAPQLLPKSGKTVTKKKAKSTIV